MEEFRSNTRNLSFPPFQTVNCKPSDVCKEEFKTVFRCRCPASGTFFFCKGCSGISLNDLTLKCLFLDEWFCVDPILLVRANLKRARLFLGTVPPEIYHTSKHCHRRKTRICLLPKSVRSNSAFLIPIRGSASTMMPSAGWDRLTDTSGCRRTSTSSSRG